MNGQHHYPVKITWTGNRGPGTTGYRDYDRNHTVSVSNKADLLCSSDTAFRGDATLYNPEDMLVASLSSCHMLWYLHLCADAGVIVTGYVDNAEGLMVESPGNGGQFKEVVLRPVVTVKEATMIQKALDLHHEAHRKCFIANSVNFTVRQEPQCNIG